MTEAETTLRQFLAAWKALDADGYVSCFAPDFVCAHPFGVTGTHDELRHELERVAEHWRDLDYRILSVVTDGEQVALEYVMTMTGSGRGFEGQIELPGLILAVVRDGRIVRYREEFDPRIVLAARMSVAHSGRSDTTRT